MYCATTKLTHVSARITVIAIGIVGPLPLALLQNLNALSFTSALAVLSMLFFGVVVILLFATSYVKLRLADEATEILGDTNLAPYAALVGEPLHLASVNANLFRAVPVALFAYACQTSIFPIKAEMSEKSAPRFNRALVNGLIFGGSLYFFVGIFGYLSFGSLTAGNVLSNYNGIGGM